MRRITRRLRNFGTTIGAALTAVTLVWVIGGAAMGPAFAQDRDHGERGRSDFWRPVRHHEPAHHRRHVRAYRASPSYGYGASPSYYNYPPPVVYAPPQPSAGINLIIPFSFR